MPFETVKWSKGRKADFGAWIHKEIWNTEGDRKELESKWVDLIVQHRARVLGDGTSDVPFVGASDIDFPLTAIHYEPVYADLMQTLHIPNDFWSVVAGSPETIGVAKPFQQFLSLVERNDIKMRAVNSKALYDLGILGTCVYKDSINHMAKTVRDYDDIGQIIKKTKIQFNPKVTHVPLQDFYIPAYADKIDPDDIGGAPWVSHKFELTEGQFVARSKGESPFLPTYDKEATKNVMTWFQDQQGEDQIKDKQRQEDEYTPFREEKILLHEVWARFDVDGDGIEEDVVVIWHQKAEQILRATHNPHIHGKRPFSSSPYIPGPGFYGIGIAEADEWAQLVMSRLLNSSINNTLLANQRMYSVPLGSNISPDEPIFGGKIWPLGPNEKVGEIRLGEVYPSLPGLMGQMMQYAEQRTSVSELRQGDLNTLPSRTPAATVAMALSEGKKKFDMVMANLRDGVYNEIGQRVVQNLIQISKDDPRYIALAQQALGPADGAKVAEILQGPVHDIEEKLGINVTATSSLANKEAEKQNLIALGQMASQYYPQLLQYAQGLAGMDPQNGQQIMASTMQAAYTGSAELMRRLLETFDIQNPDVYLPPDQGTPEQQQQQGLSQQPGAAGPGIETQALGGAFGPSPLAQGQNPLGALLGLG